MLLIFCRKPSGTIDVIGGQTATISRVEGRRRHNLEGNNIQVHTHTHAWPTHYLERKAPKEGVRWLSG